MGDAAICGTHDVARRLECKILAAGIQILSFFWLTTQLQAATFRCVFSVHARQSLRRNLVIFLKAPLLGRPLLGGIPIHSIISVPQRRAESLELLLLLAIDGVVYVEGDTRCCEQLSY